MIPQETIQDVLARADIVEVIADFIKLKKRGVNWIGLCPFHDEKTPSFTVSPAKGIYKCFGCGKSGGVATFIMEHEKVNFPDAIRWLAKRSNITIEETYSAQEQQAHEVSDSLYAVNNFAQAFFSAQLDPLSEAYAYLTGRGVKSETIARFQLGYNAGDAFAAAAMQAQYSPEVLTKAGLVKVRETDVRDTYRHRIIFPQHTTFGRICGFAARTMQQNAHEPKYINTPENEIYSKGKQLYGLYFARQHIVKKDECLLVEGQMDVISFHQAGIINTVASGGTALTEDQLRIIRKYAVTLTIIYDNDDAGITAAMRGLDRALIMGLEVNLVLLPAGEDPDSYVKKHGAEATLAYLQANKKNFVIFQTELLMAGSPSAKQKTEAVDQIALTISRLRDARDFIRRADFIRECSQRLGIDEAGLQKLVEQHLSGWIEPEHPPVYRSHSEETAVIVYDREFETEGRLLKFLLDHGHETYEEGWTMTDYIVDELSGYFAFTHPACRDLWRDWMEKYEQGERDFRNFVFWRGGEIVEALTRFPTAEDFMHSISEVTQNMIISQMNPVAQAEAAADYFKIKKIRQMIEINREELLHPGADEHRVLKIHTELKREQSRLAKKFGIIIYKL